MLIFLSINSLEGLLLITSIINGNMRTPKIYSLNNLIDWLNIKFEGFNILKKQKPINNFQLESNAWLSSFIEADCNFSIRTTTTSKYPRVECKFELNQSQIDHRGNNN